MKSIPPRRTIQPKISTIPRNKSEAAEQLDLYKMVTKRQRIQQELEFMEQRIQLLRQQLGLLDHQIENTEKTIQNLRQSTPSSSQSATPNTCSPQNTTTPNKSVKSSPFQTFYLEY
ncbi:MAG: gas vesicle protein [Brasilonema octagenarum HA4186-MV1]|jgi:chromosome segregation ATPase|uniref:Gas vesicle protein n=2 Tax=Brasilonema TaxID=383614 RepID=A0A856MLG7_9CYAN|nr:MULTISPECIES: gas vesicle protein [Brasilonema]MBW4628291.1 gas vesicle protein [Brasilonema octagenarum HA4186-MV1]NMF61396.1 gas vesicle protein [Brasilonema octagenarum UFV-OR1]QDL11528.1 gas vesicle protein [Brasilonema sennae CENA114]QDL17910.1 gas vesicle protein [Brasilonema octagenarum UFV-E1]